MPAWRSRPTPATGDGSTPMRKTLSSDSMLAAPDPAGYSSCRRANHRVNVCHEGHPLWNLLSMKAMPCAGKHCHRFRAGLRFHNAVQEGPSRRVPRMRAAFMRRKHFRPVEKWRLHPDDSILLPENWDPPEYWTYQASVGRQTCPPFWCRTADTPCPRSCHARMVTFSLALASSIVSSSPAYAF